MAPVAPDCGDGGCSVSPHAATGWCLAATGAPVLVVTTLPCPPAGDGAVDVTLIDPGTGDVVAPQAIVSCGDKDWEVNQLCDYDSGTGDLIATFIQVFEWDEDTGTLVITNVRADDPTVAYVPVGTVRACATDVAVVDVEVTGFCYDVAGTSTQGWQAWIFVDGVHTGTNIYYDIDGVVLVAPTPVECDVIVAPPVSIERRFDGDDLTNVDTITIPDGVLSFSVTVENVGAGVTIDGPDMVAMPLFNGQSIGHAADASNTINGPIVVTGTAGSRANAFWVFP